MRHTIATLGCACNQAGNTALVDQILSGMEASGRNPSMFAKKKGKKNALSTLVGKARTRAEAVVNGPKKVEGSTVGAVGGRTITTGRDNSTVGNSDLASAAIIGGLVIGAVVLYVGTGAAIGAGVAAVVADKGEKPEYAKGALIGGAGIIALGMLSK